jgi:hypothetical protein
MRKTIDNRKELQTLDLGALASIVGGGADDLGGAGGVGDPDADRDLLTTLGAAQPKDLEFCKSQVQGKMGHLSLHMMADCMRGSEHGTRWMPRMLVTGAH